MLKINNIQFPVFSPYNKPTYEIYMAGCKEPHCSGCHNPDLWDFENGKEIDSSFFKKMKEREEWFDCISILGGEPLDQNEHDFANFIFKLTVNFPNKEFWLFTGKEFEEVPEWCKEDFDVIKCGKYDETKKVNGFPASSNQKVYYKNKDY